ncbi:MAG: DUF1542 domain-containing protein, partial [Lachnospiraceae bacterium]|nr:DUF1542 domain-containing protein [Lachnospiraceae bacterium]
MKKKERLGRKLLSFLLTLAMVVGLLPGMSMTVQAATNTSGRFNVNGGLRVRDIYGSGCQIYKNNNYGIQYYDSDGTTLLKSYQPSGFVSNTNQGYDVVCGTAGVNQGYAKLYKFSETDKSAAGAVETAIDEIGTVECTDSCKTKIDSARSEYDKLTYVQQLLVSNYQTLTSAEREYILSLTKTTAKGELDTLLAEKNEADYDADDWTALTQAIADGKTAIDNATTTEGVNTAKSNAETAANAVKTKVEKLADAKTTAKNELETLKNSKTETDYDAEDWTTLTQAIADGKTAIDNATTID